VADLFPTSANGKGRLPFVELSFAARRDRHEFCSVAALNSDGEVAPNPAISLTRDGIAGAAPE
jgi:hypothetical protein